MRHDMDSCGQVEKIKRNGLTMKNQVASVMGKSKARCDGPCVAVKLEQGLGADGTGAAVKSKQSCDQ